MYLWDANILRHFGQGHPTLRLHMMRVPWREIALPSVVVAEVLRGRCDFALKASPVQTPQAHARLRETLRMLSQFHLVVFDQACAEVMGRLRQRYRRRKRYADLMIAAMAIAGRHVVVTRNTADFIAYLPGCEVPKITPENYATGYGLISDYLAEIVRLLRRRNFQTHMTARLSGYDRSESGSCSENVHWLTEVDLSAPKP